MKPKVFIVVTNYREGQPVVEFGKGDTCNTVITKRTVAGFSKVGDWYVSSQNKQAVCSWGLFGPLSKGEATRLGGDFGVWFSS